MFFSDPESRCSTHMAREMTNVKLSIFRSEHLYHLCHRPITNLARPLSRHLSFVKETNASAGSWACHGMPVLKRSRPPETSWWR